MFGNKNVPVDGSEENGAKSPTHKMSHHDERHMTKLIKNKLKNKDELNDEEYAFAEEHDLLLSKEEKHMMKEIKAKLKRGESLYADEEAFAFQHKLMQ